MRPVRKPSESMLEYTERVNKWKKEKLKEYQASKNEQTKRDYRIQPKKVEDTKP
jgi:hypothetical protein